MKSPARRAEDAAAASQAQQLAAGALRQMLTGCTAVESIIVMDLLQRSHDLARAVANLASAMRHDGEPQFIVEGQRYGLAEMLSANRDDAELCEWARRAQPGDVFPAYNDCRRI